MEIEYKRLNYLTCCLQKNLSVETEARLQAGEKYSVKPLIFMQPPAQCQFIILLLEKVNDFSNQNCEHTFFKKLHATPTKSCFSSAELVYI